MSYSTLDIDNPRIIQPWALNVELMEHQKTSVYAMMDLEKKGYVDINFRYFDNENKNLRLETNLGILGDKVASGKTLIILSLLIESPTVPNDRAIYYSSDKYITIREQKPDDDKLNINVIMVPKCIQHQWELSIKNDVKNNVIRYYNHIDATTRNILEPLNYLNNKNEYETKNEKHEPENKEKKLLDLDEKQDINKQLQQTVKYEKNRVNVVICNERTVNDLIELHGNKKWNRFIIDEADTILFAGLNKIKASFIWLITGTTNGIACSNKKFIKEIFGKNLTWQPDFLTIKNKNEFVNESLKLPKPNRIVINCLTPIEIKLLANHIPKHVMNMINAGNSDQAIKTLNCHVDTADNIYKVISRNYEMAIRNKEIEFDAENKKKYNNIEKEQEHMKRMKKIETVIEKLKLKLNSMKNSLYDTDANDTMCPVCMDEFDKPTMVDCCAHKYCFNCLALTLNNTKNKCPVCQTIITKKRIHILCEDKLAKKTYINTTKKDKIEELLDIIKSSVSCSKFLVFADFDETFNKIEKVFDSFKIKYGILRGTGNKIKETVEKFKKGNISVIMLNAKNFGAGMNLQCATDVIMYHRFTKEMEEQIIGRGQRIGRNGILNVYYLIHDNENDSFHDDNFNDISHQEYLENNYDENYPVN